MAGQFIKKILAEDVIIMIDSKIKCTLFYVSCIIYPGPVIKISVNKMTQNHLKIEINEMFIP